MSIYAKPGTSFTAVVEGMSTGLVGVLGVRIEAGDGSNVSPRTVAGIVEVEPGSGTYVTDDLVAPAEDGTYLVMWDSGGPEPVFASEDLIVVPEGAPTAPVGPGYPSRAELVAASSNEHLKALSGAQQDALRADAITMVEAYTGQSFESEGTPEAPVTRTVAGSGARELYLPRRIEEITALSVPGGSLSLSDVEIAENHDRIFLIRQGSSSWVERALADLTARAFPRGQDIVTITGVWGWAECPEAVVSALRMDMEDAASASSADFAPSLQAWRKLGMSSMSQGPLNIQLENRPMTLSPRAADMLDAAGMVWADIGELL
jgi:hypothetical protein